MKLVTWNVNSLRARAPRVQAWLEENEPDVCCLQETKCEDSAFPSELFSSLGYVSAHHGNGRWNGVAILSRLGMENVRSGFFDDAPGSIEECRVLAATCGPLDVFSVYVPNGRSVDSEHYVNKLKWLGRLRAELEHQYGHDAPFALCGDFNVAPEDRDVWDIEQFVGATHVSPAEREAFAALLSFGLVDSVRALNPEGEGPFSWWDYRQGHFHRGFGMRIDHILVSAPLAGSLVQAYVDRDARKGPGPSDHAPVVVELAI